MNTDECPICMEGIDANKNCLTTECGHRFHTRCLMTNVATNGFGCPNCRATMAVAKDDEMWRNPGALDVSGNYGDIVQGGHMVMRMNESEFVVDGAVWPAEGGETPTIDDIQYKLEARGITMRDMIASAMMEHPEYDDEYVQCAYNTLFRNMREIITSREPMVAPSALMPAPLRPLPFREQGGSPLSLLPLSSLVEDWNRIDAEFNIGGA